ncbi:hypothetical protein SCO11_09660 [Legionella pneumophila serogroup 1]|uniref:hypothetical protein n=1 Tax=Legionella pneumophila TaxID=446 RepID=UPI000770ABAF|nr:hypothetical protein [Legionella pneumophila]MCZ4679300.1 hypothetical protein [Legionella pneumophila]MCZ4749263.1 hypothetical protein [Legionella pneumophila]MDW8863634.1 hypothetical protein [Legionella pneumophila]MDW8888219.1 hypothetical protein [Legionella pneumophila]MDW9013343.1 hypothetical protein [Legionella pneumophila]
MSFLIGLLSNFIGGGMIGAGILGLIDGGKELNILMALGLGAIILLLVEIKDKIVDE